MKPKTIILIFVLLIINISIVYLITYKKINKKTISSDKTKKAVNKKSSVDTLYLRSIKDFCFKNNYNTSICFVANTKLHSGKNRFFVYNLSNYQLLQSGLMSHGSCNTNYLYNAKYSNEIGSGCSSLGKYKISYSYNGQFGKAYKLIGLDSSNSNAFSRFVVLHAYDCVPSEETYPSPICNSLGCPMVSYSFLQKLSFFIDTAQRPIILIMK